MLSEKFFDRLIGITTRRPLLISLIGLFMALSGVYFTLKIPLETDIVKLLPDDILSVRILKNAKQMYGGVGNIVFVIDCPDFSSALSFAKVLRERLIRSGKVIYAEYKPEREFFEKYGLLLLPVDKLRALKEDLKNEVRKIKLRASPFYFDLEGEGESKFDLEELIKKYAPKSLWDSISKKYYTNRDKSVLLLFVQPKAALTDMKAVTSYLKEMNELADSLQPHKFHRSLKVSIGGTFRNRADEYRTILRDVKISAGTTLILIFTLLSLFFNQAVAIPVILLPLIESIAFTSGLAYLFVGRLNFVSAFLFAILLGLGVDFGIHIFTRYLEEREKGVKKSLITAISDTSTSCIAAALTTSASLYVLVLFRFKGFSEFGLLSGTGVIISYVWYVLFLPPLIVLMEKIGLIRSKKFTLSEKLFSLMIKYQRYILIAGLITIITGGAAAKKIKLQTDFSSLRANLPSTELVKRKIGSVFSLSASPAIAITSSLRETRYLEKIVKEKMKNDPTPTIDTFLGLSTLLPENQAEKIALIKEMNGIFSDKVIDELKGREREEAQRLKKMLKVRTPITIRDIPESLLRRFTDKSGRPGTVSYIYPSVELVQWENALKFKKDVLNIPSPDGRVFHAVNDNIVLADLYQLVIIEGRVTSLIILLLIFIIILASFRKFSVAVLVNTPLWIGLMCSLGFHALTGHKLNLFNMIVIPVLLGVGIDNSIHISKRLLKSMDLRKTLVTTGSASFYTTVTTAVGFGSLITAYHEGLHSIGRLALTGLFFMLLFTVFVFPLFFHSFLQKKNRT